jgi:hypothetical protein
MSALYLDVSQQASTIGIRMAAVRWMLKYEFGIQSLGMEETERQRLDHYRGSLAAAAA